MLCLVVGIAPELTVAPLLAVAAAGTLQTPLPEADFGLLHAFESELQSALQLAGMNDSNIHEAASRHASPHLHRWRPTSAS